MHRRLVRVLSAAAFTGAVALAGCGSDDPYLSALQEDPMAQWEPTGGELRHESTQGYDAGGSTSKQRLARVIRTFALPTPQDVLPAQQQALQQARSSGWGRDELEREGFLQRPGARSSTFTLTALPSATDERELVITLTAP